MSRWYPSLTDVLALHEDQLSRYGGAPGVRDMALIEAALFRPQTGYYKDIIEEACALWESFMQNHPFIDGNKRVALAVMDTFLGVNAIDTTFTPDEFIDFIYDLFDRGEVNFENLDAWLRGHVEAV